MKAIIECKPRREGGSVVTVNGTDYFFEPQTPRGPHVCEVTDFPAYERFSELPDYAVLSVDWEGEPNPATLTASLTGLVTHSDDDDQPEPEAPASGGGLEAMTDEQLAAEHHRLLGTAPHGRAKRETIIKTIQAALKAA